MTRFLRLSLAAAAGALLVVATASAAVNPLFKRASARVGERVAVDCGYVGLHPGDVVLYLIKLNDVSRLFAVSRTSAVVFFDGPPPRDRRLHNLGACRIRGQGNGHLTFTVPNVAPGRYTLVVWCKTCRKGGDHWYMANALWDDAPGSVLRVRR